jgi:hypothetical protein
MTPEQLVKHLELEPHPEGGFYKEMYRSEAKLLGSLLAKDLEGDRNFSTAIYFLIEKENFSALHKIKSDEIWHFYAGDALEVMEISNSGQLKITLVGNKLDQGEVFQYTVKANTWFGSRVKSGGTYSLVGCTVSPGFDFRDFEMAKRNDLLEKFPEHKGIIEQMTRD